MASDREVIRLIKTVQTGKLPKPTQSLVEAVVEEAISPSLMSSMTFRYNPDGTLNTINTDNSKLSFIWNHDGSLHKINTYKP